MMEPPRHSNKRGKSHSISEALDIVGVITYYGGNPPSSPGWRKMRCLHGERNPSAVINSELGAYSCFSCGLRGDTISIIRKMENDCSFQQACVKYKEITGQEVPGRRGKRDSSGSASAAEQKRYESEGWLAHKLREGD